MYLKKTKALYRMLQKPLQMLLLIAVARGLVEDKDAVQVTVDPAREDGTVFYHLKVPLSMISTARCRTLTVLPSSLLETDFSYCAPFSESEAKSLFPEAKYAQKDGSFYGFLLYDAKTKQGKWQEYISYTDENYYLCFRKGAPHAGDHIHFAENQIITSFLKGIFTE